jgi:ribosomal protein L5
MDITIVTDRERRRRGRALLSALGFPFVGTPRASERARG